MGQHLITLGELESDSHIGAHWLLGLFSGVGITAPEIVVGNVKIDHHGRPGRVFGIEVCLELDEASEILGIALRCGDWYCPLQQEGDTLKTEDGTLRGKLAFTPAKTKDDKTYTRVSLRLVSSQLGVIFNVPVLIEKDDNDESLASALEAAFTAGNYDGLTDYIAPPRANYLSIEELTISEPYKVVEIGEPKLLTGVNIKGPWKQNVYQVVIVMGSRIVPVSSGFALCDQINDKVAGWSQAKRPFETVNQVFGLPNEEWWLIVDDVQLREGSTEDNPKYNTRARLVRKLPLAFTQDS